MPKQTSIRRKLFIPLFLGCAWVFADSVWGQEMPPPGGASPEEIARYERALARRIIADRAGAEQGDLLTADLTRSLRIRFRALLDSEDGVGILATIQEVDAERSEVALDPEFLLAINEVLPENAVLPTMPPQVLAAFPKLPVGVEYRFVGCRLILLAREPRIILDYTKECFW